MTCGEQRIDLKELCARKAPGALHMVELRSNSI